MSLNRVLNRPMFRREALRKGHLKPIKARVGRSIIGPMQPPVPAVIPKGTPLGVPVGGTYSTGLALRAQPTFFERMGTGAKSLGRNIFSIPAIGGFYAGDKVAQAMGINDPIGRTAAGFGGSYVASKALPTLAGIGMVPSAVGLGTIYALQNRVKAGIEERKRINAMSPKERAEFFRQNRIKATDYMSEGVTDEELFGKIDTTKLDEIVKKPRTTIPDPGAGRPGSKRFEQKQEDVATAPDNVTKFGKTKVIDTAKVAENTLPPQLSDRGGSMDDMSGAMPAPGGEDPKQDPPKDDPKEDPKGKGDPNLDTINANSPFKAQLDLARQIAKEMRQGKTSQANMVFLSNLASGLLTGTTRKAGLGGALEVFGAALGPAVNNMVMVKMKEDEIEQNLLGRALEFSTDFLKAQNQAFEMPDTKEVGVIQYTNEAGRTVNVAGRILIDGTKQINTGKKDANGLNIFQTVDPNLNFIPNSDQNKETLDLAKSIAGKYAAVNLINRSLGIIEKGEAQAGVTGAIGLYGGRVTEALGDVFDFVKVGGDDVSEVKAAGKAMFNLQRETAAADLVSDGVFDNKQQALNYLDRTLGSFEKNRRSSLSNAKKRLKGGNALDYERLAINETVLVYKLANSLKSKDRLTQKDIEMAKGLVKVFPLLRGERNVIASLTATAETILDDIKQQERLYERAGGSSQYLLDERRAYGLIPDGTTLDTFEEKQLKFRELEKKIGEMTEEDFKKIFPNL